jgi:hypothetical protein
MKKMIGVFVQNHLFLNMKVGNVISTKILFLTIFQNKEGGILKQPALYTIVSHVCTL